MDKVVMVVYCPLCRQEQQLTGIPSEDPYCPNDMMPMILKRATVKTKHPVKKVKQIAK